MHIIIINYKITNMNTKTDSRKNSKDYNIVTNSEKSDFLTLISRSFTNIGNIQKPDLAWINYCFW